MKLRWYIAALAGVLGVAPFTWMGCDISLDVPGGGTYPSRVNLSAEVLREFDDLTISWQGQWLGFRNLPDNMARLTWENAVPQNSTTLPSPPMSPFTQTLALTPDLTPGLWRFQFTISGTESASGQTTSVTVVCDQELAAVSINDATPTINLTVRRTGCTSDNAALLRASAVVTDFSTNTTGQAPYDWSAFGDTTGSSWTVETGGGIGGKQLQGNQTTGAPRALIWQEIPQQADIEVLVKVQTHETDATYPSPILIARAQAGIGYAVGLRNGNQVIIARVQNDGSLGANIASSIQYKTYSPDTWYWIRFRVSGTDPAEVGLRATVWQVGDPEPNTPTYAFNDPAPASAITDPGRVGIATLTAGADPWVDFVSVGIAGTGAVPPLTITCDNEPAPYHMCL